MKEIFGPTNLEESYPKNILTTKIFEEAKEGTKSSLEISNSNTQEEQVGETIPIELIFKKVVIFS